MPKILIVDDDPIILMSLEFLMKKNKFDVTIARNGTEALQSLKTDLPDIVILDVMMPDVDGFAICETIKNNPKTEHIQVIFVSAKSKESDIKYGLDLGASLYITKPFSTRDLLKKVNELLQN